MQEHARAEREGNRTAGTKRELNASKGVFKEMNGAETESSRELTGLRGKGNERPGRLCRVSV